MYPWWYVPALIPIGAAVICLLYRRGLAVTKRIAAVLFVFRPGKGADRVELTSCTGWVRHMGRFRGSRAYAFELDDQLSAGETEVLLLDREKRPLLKLNRQSPSGVVELDGTGRYYLRWEFRAATGRCELRWGG